MKTLKQTLVAGLLAISMAGAAQAQTVIHIAGSTAFRTNTHTAILHALGSTDGKTLTSGSYGYTGSSLSGASQAIFTGTTAGVTGTVTIKTAWSGSVGGVQCVAKQLVNNFLANTTPMSAAGSSGAASSLVNEQDVPEVAMSDVFQQSTPFTSPPLSEVTAGGIGVIPFSMVCTPNVPATVASGTLNITPQLAQQLWVGGSLPLSMFTGNASDTATMYATGRDADSGTRLTQFAEQGIGVATTVYQYQPVFSAACVTGTGTVSTAGSGYTSNPASQIYGSGGYGYTSPTIGFVNDTRDTTGVNAAATATVSSGVITGFTITNKGSGYTYTPNVTITDASGSGASGTALMSSGTISAIILLNPGTGATGTCTVTSGTVSAFSVTAGGSGYTAAPSVKLIGGGGSGGAVTAILGHGTISGEAAFPVETVNGIKFIAGNGGYASGGNVAPILSGTTTNGDMFCANLGTSDLGTAIALGAKPMTYNGYSLGSAPYSGILNGQYTLWGYEHLYYANLGLNSQNSTNQLTVIQNVSNKLLNTDAQVLLQNMNVYRSIDGGSIAPF